MSDCFCAALTELAVLSDDPREETRLRRTLYGIEIQRWRLASTIVVPDGGDGGTGFDTVGLAGAIPRAVRVDESTVENLPAELSPGGRVSHEPT